MNILPLLLLLLALAAWLALTVGVGVYVYRDARRRGMNAALWALVALLAPSLIGFAVYLVVRGGLCGPGMSGLRGGRGGELCRLPPLRVQAAGRLPGCAKPVEPDWIVCPRCATPLQPGGRSAPPCAKGAAGLARS